jgi:hypothetical protein
MLERRSLSRVDRQNSCISKCLDVAHLRLVKELRSLSYLGYARITTHALAGSRTEAVQDISQLLEISRSRYVSPYGVARVYAALDDKEQTFKWLQNTYDDRAVWMSYLAVDPVFDRFRSDQRF